MNPVVHFEMPFEDRERMAKFYNKAFGWQPLKLGPEMGDYVVVLTSEVDPVTRFPKQAGRINGGLFRKTDDRQIPSVVIAVADIKQAMKKVVEVGGRLIDGQKPGEPDMIPSNGLYVSFTDTEGNRVGMIEPIVMAVGAAADNEFIATRVFDAPHDLLWRTWTDSVLLAKWFGPRAISVPECVMSAKRGNAYRLVMRDQSGVNFPINGLVVEADAPTRLVLTLDLMGHPTSWKEMLGSQLKRTPVATDLESVMSVELDDFGSRTRLVVNVAFTSTEVRDAYVATGMKDGWEESFDKLAELLPTIKLE